MLALVPVELRNPRLLAIYFTITGTVFLLFPNTLVFIAKWWEGKMGRPRGIGFFRSSTWYRIGGLILLAFAAVLWLTRKYLEKV